jgi:hypothetical protein
MQFLLGRVMNSSDDCEMFIGLMYRGSTGKKNLVMDAIRAVRNRYDDKPEIRANCDKALAAVSP